MACSDDQFWSSLDSTDLDRHEKTRLIRDFFRPRKLVSVGFILFGMIVPFLPDLPERALVTFALSADGCLLYWAYLDIERGLLANV